MAYIAISWFHAYGCSKGGSIRECSFSSPGGYVIAHNIHSPSGASVSMGEATVHISNLMHAAASRKDVLKKPFLVLDSLARHQIKYPSNLSHYQYASCIELPPADRRQMCPRR